MILGRMTEARLEAPEAEEVVCSVRMVLWCAMQEYSKGVAGVDDEDAMVAGGNMALVALTGV